MFVLGLTGSLAMGKSAAARFFKDEGVPVHDADATVHRLYESEAVPVIEAAFPGTTAGGKVDRTKLAARVVGDPAALKRLEGIVHPMVQAAEAEFLAKVQSAGATVAVLDVPLLYETGGDQRVDAVVVVSAPAEVQRARILKRDGISLDKLDALLARQLPDAEKRRRADFVVDTSGEFAATHAQLREILRAVTTMPKRRK